MPNNLAIDLVLLPPSDITRQIILINRKMRVDHQTIRLNNRTCFPHISLAMGCIDKVDLNRVKSLLTQTAMKSHPLSLKVVKIHESKSVFGKTKHSWFLIQKSRLLYNLHQELMIGLKKYWIKEIYPKDFIRKRGETTNESTLRWVRCYPQDASFDNFTPHITLGKGSVLQRTISFPIPFLACRLAICHLGNHCTCLKILFERSLTS